MKRKNPFASGQEKHQDKKHAAPMSIDEGKTEPEDSRTTTDAAKDPGAPDNEDDLIEAVVLRQEDLVPPREKFSWSPSLATAPWSEQYTALEHFRQSIKFHPSSIQTAAFPDAEACLNGLVVPSAEHLRSALSRSGLYCISEYVQCVGESATVHSGLFIPVLLRRSINEKRFIRDAALEALDHVATCCSPLELLQVLVSFSNDKNPNLVATAGKYVEKILRRCQDNTTPNQWSTWQPHVSSWLPSLAQFLACRVVVCKNDTKRAFALLRDVVGAAEMTQLANDQLTGSALVDVLQLVKPPSKKAARIQPTTRPGASLSLRERMRQQQHQNRKAPPTQHLTTAAAPNQDQGLDSKKQDA